MLIEIFEIPRKRYRTLTKKIIKLDCDECHSIFNRRWQREIVEQKQHFCGRKCQAAWFKKQKHIHQKSAAKNRERYEDPNVRNAARVRAKEISERPEVRERRSLAQRARFARMSEEELALYRNEKISWFQVHENYEKFLHAQRKPELRALRSQQKIDFWSIHENIERLSAWSQAQWKPGGIFRTPEFSRALSDGQKKSWTEERRLSVSGIHNPMSGHVVCWWKPWMTNLHSDIEWANEIRRMCNRMCINCGKSQFTNENYDYLFAHHIVPKSIDPNLRHDMNNGIALCLNCHIGHHGVHHLLRIDAFEYERLMHALLEKRDELRPAI